MNSTHEPKQKSLTVLVLGDIFLKVNLSFKILSMIQSSLVTINIIMNDHPSIHILFKLKKKYYFENNRNKLAFATT